MRNQPKPVSAFDAKHAAHVARSLELASHREVTLSYVKRDGNTSSSTGTVKFFNGQPGMDTHSVTLDTLDKGPRTINLHRVVTVV